MYSQIDVSTEQTPAPKSNTMVKVALGVNVAVVALLGCSMLSGSSTTVEPQFVSMPSTLRVASTPVAMAPPAVQPLSLNVADKTLATKTVHTKTTDMSMLAVLGHMLTQVPAKEAFAAGKKIVAGNKAFTALASSGFEDALGAQPPLGFWDPLGLLNDADEERFDRLRTVETKHGRISMLAILGHLVTTAGVRLPGDIAFGLPFADMKTGLAAFDTIPAAGIAQIIAFIGAIEIGYSQWKESGEEWALGVFGWDAETTERKMAIELNNGRAAQMGILALMVHEKLDNNPYIINSLLGAPVPFN
jgi:hypothetical protein